MNGSIVWFNRHLLKTRTECTHILYYINRFAAISYHEFRWIDFVYSFMYSKYQNLITLSHFRSLPFRSLSCLRSRRLFLSINTLRLIYQNEDKSYHTLIYIPWNNRMFNSSNDYIFSFFSFMDRKLCHGTESIDFSVEFPTHFVNRYRFKQCNFDFCFCNCSYSILIRINSVRCEMV